MSGGDAKNSPGRFVMLASLSAPISRFSSLEKVENRAKVILDKSKGRGFLDKRVDSQEVVNLVEEIRNAIVFYQVSGNHMR